MTKSAAPRMNVKLLRKIQKHILAEPRRYNQNAWINKDPEVIRDVNGSIARLIAAAPQLYQAVKDLLAQVDAGNLQRNTAAKSSAAPANTPGKWQVLPVAGWVNVYRMYDEHYNIQPTTEDARHANGRLMTAAPQMYAKLLSIARKIDDASGHPSFTAKETDELSELLEAIHG